MGHSDGPRNGSRWKLGVGAWRTVFWGTPQKLFRLATNHFCRLCGSGPAGNGRASHAGEDKDFRRAADSGLRVLCSFLHSAASYSGAAGCGAFRHGATGAACTSRGLVREGADGPGNRSYHDCRSRITRKAIVAIRYFAMARIIAARAGRWDYTLLPARPTWAVAASRWRSFVQISGSPASSAVAR